MTRTELEAMPAREFSWKHPWGNRAINTRLAEMLSVRYLYVDPEVLVRAELARRAAVLAVEEGK